MNINKRLLRKTHRYIGAVCAFFILFLTSTGILLNHTDFLQLEKIMIKNPYLLSWYGIKPPVIKGLFFNQHWFVSDEQFLYADNRALTECSKIINIKTQDTIIYIACSDRIILLTATLELVEIVDENAGLPTPIQAFTLNNNQLIVLVQKQQYSASLDNMTFNKDMAIFADKMPSLQSPPNNIQRAIQLLADSYSINVERVLLDIHSGRILGSAGVFFVDATGIMLLLLAMSGLYIWLKR